MRRRPISLVEATDCRRHLLAYDGSPSADLALETSIELASASRGRPRGIPVTKLVSPRPIEQALLREAREGDHDLVILGSRGRGPIRSALFGSVGRTMLRHGPLPVLIVSARPDTAPVPDETGSQIAPMTPRRA